jgi:O-antigen ligase
MESHQMAFRNWSSHKNWILFFGAVVISSLFYSRYVLSIGMFAWVALSFFEETSGRGWRFRPWFRWFGRNPAEQAISAFPLIFVMVFISLLWSDWTSFGLSRVRLALPFIGLPLAFLHLPHFRAKDIDFLKVVLVLSAVVSMAHVIFHAFVSTSGSGLDRGQSLATPVSHVRYGLLIALSSLSAFNLFYFKSSLSFARRMRWGMGVFCLVLIFFTFYLSVRTGWMALLIGFILLFFDLAIRRKKTREVLVLMASMVALLFISYMAFPTVKQKINYSFYDWKQLAAGKGWTTSDATRWRSYVIAGDIFLDHPYLGAGAGDIKQEVNTRFDRYYPQSAKKILPHNQYLYWLATYGLLGFFLLLGIAIQPLGFKAARENISHVQIQVILLLAFLVEAHLQTSLGIGIYLVFSLLFLSNLAAEGSNRGLGKDEK